MAKKYRPLGVPSPQELQFDEQKTTEAASILLELSGGTMNYMKLIKLLYFIDRKAYEVWERPITNDIIFSMKDGQVLSGVYDLVKNNKTGDFWHKYIVRTKAYDVMLSETPIKLKKLSPAEVDLINTIFEELGKFDQYYLGKLSKNYAEYKQTASSIRTTLDDLLSALNYDKDDIERIKENLNEQAMIEAIFQEA